MDVGALQPYINSHTSVALVFTISLLWLLYRLKHVFDAPVDDLVKILGIEVPVAPLVSLLEITSSGVRVRWQPADQRNGGLRFGISVNGFKVGEVNHQESAVHVSGLLPSTRYTIRIIAINQSNYTAASTPVQIRTRPDQHHVPANGYHRALPEATLSHSHSHTTTQSLLANAVVTAYRPTVEHLPAKVLPPLSRESSNTNLLKRGGAGRTFQAPDTNDRRKASSAQDSTERETIDRLNTELESLRVQLRRQDEEDEAEESAFHAAEAELNRERDELRQRVKDRDEHLKELNKSVKSLEHTYSAVERKMKQQQAAVDEKRRERVRMKEAIERWGNELPDIEAESETWRKSRQDIIHEGQLKVEKIKADQKPSLDAIAEIEQQISEKGKIVNQLDADRKKLDEGTDDADNALISALEAERDRFEIQLSDLRLKLGQAQISYNSLASMHHQLLSTVQMVSADRRGSLTNAYSTGYSPSPYDMAQGGIVEPSYSSPNGRVNFELPEPRNGQTSIHSRNGNSSTTSARTASPFVPNKMSSYTMRYQHQPKSGPHDFEGLTGGALISPSADGLLPSDLLGEDDSDGGMVKPHLWSSHIGRPGSSSSRPNSIRSRRLSTNLGMASAVYDMENDSRAGGDQLGGYGAADPRYSPHSPAASFGSNSPSLMSSPHSGYQFLNRRKASDPNLGHFESDQRSIRSASGSSRTANVSKGFFGGLRARGRTTSNEGPQLGSLKPYQSQSVPVDAAEAAPKVPTRDLFKHMMSARSHGSRETNNLGPIGSPSPSHRSISRPASTYSTESSFPKPSNSASLFGWSASKENLGKSNGVQSAAIWSDRWDSRRPSLIEGSIEATQLTRANADKGHTTYGAGEDARLSPIGASIDGGKAALSATQLNPAARDFTSMFGFGKRSEKSEKASKLKKKKGSSAEDLAAPEATEGSGSPADSRKSRDTRPSSFGGSFEDLADDVEQLPLTPTETAAQPSPRDSLMRRITRKGSSGKFSLAALKEKKDKGGLFSRKSTHVPEEGDDDSGLGRSLDSITSITPAPTSTPEKRSSAFSLASLRSRKSKKTSESISEVSLSETGDQDDARTSFDGTSL